MPESEVAGGSDVSGSIPSVAEENKPYHPKRPHRKSRNGCKNCKRRKVKCDEGKPSCRTCTIRRETCVYLSTGLATAQSSSSSSSTRLPLSRSLPVLSLSSAQVPQQLSLSSSSSSSETTITVSDSSPPSSDPCLDPDLPLAIRHSSSSSASPPRLQLLQEPIFIPANRDVDDVKLLWAYSCTTYLSFVTQIEGVEKLERAVRNKVLEYAITSPFLMDCVLALTSMHMDRIGMKELSIPRTKSILYRARTFEGYRKAVEAADPATFPALICCSLLLCALSSQMFLVEDHNTRRLYILNWIVVWRGIGMVIDLTSPKMLAESGLIDLFMRPAINLNLSALHIPSNLLFMVSSIKLGDVDFPDVEVYYDTLKFLGSLYKELKENGFNPILDLRIITFYTFVPSRFVDLARSKRPRALIILAYHLAFLKIGKTIWWTEGICDSQILDICEFLGSSGDNYNKQWDSLLAVPRAATRLTEVEDIAKMLLENHAWESPTPIPSFDEMTGGKGDKEDDSHSRGFWSGLWVNGRGEKQDFFPDKLENL